ncbi:HEAT repeat domain-containing protein [Streptomyces boncukensis]|uniref:HEAT repeat domain-containing protein n=1 Tax=Streptomyces boncukensis TaxID=2711219 RepID=A0A6G4X0W2_9ACTN|nr:HEAT repeat domain-containing protein [Streptomyces boncukensis]NGO70497.1 HEAT repeat domain-containing protein [Streptomyces boncukensis]
MFVDSGIAPSGTLLGLLQRGRGDGTLHALAAPRAEALSALWHCVLHDPRRDWQIEDRSLYYARLHRELDAGLDAIERHLFAPEDLLCAPDEAAVRTGLALSVLGHLASYGTASGATAGEPALRLLRRYATAGANWQWALDELAVRDDDAGLRPLGPAVLARFPRTPEGEAELAAAARDAFEPRPWRLWAEDPAHPEQAERLRRVREHRSFDRWQRQLRGSGPRPGWSVREVLDWAQEGYEQHPPQHRVSAAARCLSAVAGVEERAELLEAARGPRTAARAAALRHLADREDPGVLDLIEEAAGDPSPDVASAALSSLARMRGTVALARARRWAARPGDTLPEGLVATAAEMLACHGGPQDADAVLAALRRTVRLHGPDADGLWALVDGAGRLSIVCAAPVLRHIYRETASSQLRGRTARALAATDPSFGAGFAIECLWDCEESTREVAAQHAATGDDRVVERLRRLAADPAEEAGVQSAVRGRLRPGPGR